MRKLTPSLNTFPPADPIRHGPLDEPQHLSRAKSLYVATSQKESIIMPKKQLAEFPRHLSSRIVDKRRPDIIFAYALIFGSEDEKSKNFKPLP